MILAARRAVLGLEWPLGVGCGYVWERVARHVRLMLFLRGLLCVSSSLLPRFTDTTLPSTKQTVLSVLYPNTTVSQQVFLNCIS